MQAYIFLAVYRHRDDVGGLDVVETITYVWLTQALIASIQVFGWPELGLRIKSGDVATDLARPVHPLRVGLAFDLGRALYHTIFRGIPPFLLGALVFEVTVPRDPFVWVAFAVSVVLAIVVSYAFRALYNMSAFWLLDHRGTMMLGASAIAIFSGLYVPLQFFPDWLETFARATPFPALVQIPVDIFVGQARGSGILAALALQAAWAAAMFGLAQAVFAAGTRKLVVQGG
jgi:ABC-2 type transport system permease protein